MAVSRPMIAMRRMSPTLGTRDQETLSGPSRKTSGRGGVELRRLPDHAARDARARESVAAGGALQLCRRMEIGAEALPQHPESRRSRARSASGSAVDHAGSSRGAPAGPSSRRRRGAPARRASSRRRAAGRRCPRDRPPRAPPTGRRPRTRSGRRCRPTGQARRPGPRTRRAPRPRGRSPRRDEGAPPGSDRSRRRSRRRWRRGDRRPRPMRRSASRRRRRGRPSR